MKLPLTYLFVPGNRPERFDKALAAGAGAVILDLEDAVSPKDKAQARANIIDWALAHSAALDCVFVRINDATTPLFKGDLECIRRSGIANVMLPKAESASQVGQVMVSLPKHGAVMPIIESARGVVHVNTIAAAAGVQRLAFGTLDYAVDLALTDDERGLIHPSAQIAIASRAAGIASPVAGVTPALDDESRLLADLAFARAFGFGAKLCIHPKQVAAIHRAMQPSAVEVDWARRVLAAAAASEGAVQVDGKMVDRPVLLHAQSILDRCAE
ncbi:MAG: CoA ester lyase [Casimicrobiaceae bacterium]